MKDERPPGAPDRRHWKSDKRRKTDHFERAPWDLLIDYDHPRDIPGWREGPDDVEERLRVILTARLARAGYMIDGWDFRPSTNGHHLKIRLDTHTAPVESVALQSICGSDPSRESCNVQRAREVERWAREADGGSDVAREAVAFWRTRWNVLYQPNPQRKRTTP